MSEKSTTKPSAPEKNGAGSGPQVNVFAVHGVDPEVQAYAMAKYSRSALSMKESLREISEQKAEQFLNTFYFQYGHRSIADLAHIALAVEKLSILAAIVLVDETRWDGQERSTRYQNFKKSGYYVPDFGADAAAREQYTSVADFLFAEYDAFTQEMLRYYTGQVTKPADMPEEAYTRTLRARAFDNSRYLLPLATNTSLGQIVNARTLETQIARLLSSQYKEVHHLGEMLKQAAREPAFNVQTESFRRLVEEIKAANPELGTRAEQLLLREVKVAPTLVKYANASDYEIKTRQELAAAAAALMGEVPLQRAPLVDLIEEGPLEVELAATLVYSACHYPYRQVRERIQGMTAAQREEIIKLGMKHRGPHDELLRSFHAGRGFCFDILMDIGGFRDMHRHRRCTQIEQGFTRHHGYDTPEDIVAAGLETRYKTAMQRVCQAFDQLSRPAGEEEAAVYILPMAFRKRTLFKMDFAEALYISELRSGQAGHFSYRKVACAIHEEVSKKHPSLAGYFRVTGFGEPVDLLKR
ncbi:MAG TPA: FAD-dependent thymidylate synthase [Candidatus Limnocylindrales bacterium]|nr:FAD-dependent thymidylate synthase [Candidatus Limnocylindrales bacterium]